MNISDYEKLITNLHVKQQCFTTKRKTWEGAEKKIDWLASFNDNLFNGNHSISISRKDIFETENIRQKIIKTIYWGYPNGMRGPNFVSILTDIEIIEKSLNKIKQVHEPSAKDFYDLKNVFKEVKGLGLSTYSKLLYFFQISIDKNPCLILDQRLIDVFASKTYSEFHELEKISYGISAENNYLHFLNITNQLSEKLKTNGENIEQFLFIFGKNLSE
jgi:hypothetical protein